MAARQGFFIWPAIRLLFRCARALLRNPVAGISCKGVRRWLAKAGNVGTLRALGDAVMRLHWVARSSEELTRRAEWSKQLMAASRSAVSHESGGWRRWRWWENR